jgi:hypothetical protein
MPGRLSACSLPASTASSRSLSAGLRASGYLLPQHLLNEAAKSQIPRQLVRDSEFMLFLSISRQKLTSRATALGALVLWIAAVVGIASALLNTGGYAWIAVAAGGVVVGMLGFAVYVGWAARGPQDHAPQHSAT